MIYVAGKKLVPVMMVPKDQRMIVLHKRSRGSPDKGHTTIMLNIREAESEYIEFKKIVVSAICGSLEVKFGVNSAELGTL